MSVRQFAFFCLAIAAAAGCADHVQNIRYIDTSQLHYDETKALMEKALLYAHKKWGVYEDFEVLNTGVYKDKVVATLRVYDKDKKVAEEKRCEIVYEGQTNLNVLHTGATAFIDGLKLGCPKVMPSWDYANRASAAAFLQAVLRFQKLGPDAEAKERRAREEQKLMIEEFANKPRPPLPEEARRFKIQAEAAFDEKRYELSADFYAKGLAIAPYWAEGYYNRALILAERGFYDRAIEEMNKFLALSPQSPEARKAKDTIYVWETKGGQASAYPSVDAPGAACFVATAAFGDANHPDVEYLRRFRSEVLAHSSGGRTFIDFYWWAGPKAAAVVEHDILLRWYARSAIMGLVGALKLHERL